MLSIQVAANNALGDIGEFKERHSTRVRAGGLAAGLLADESMQERVDVPGPPATPVSGAAPPGIDTPSGLAQLKARVSPAMLDDLKRALGTYGGGAPRRGERKPRWAVE